MEFRPADKLLLESLMIIQRFYNYSENEFPSLEAHKRLKIANELMNFSKLELLHAFENEKKVSNFVETISPHDLSCILFYLTVLLK